MRRAVSILTCTYALVVLVALSPGVPRMAAQASRVSFGTITSTNAGGSDVAGRVVGDFNQDGHLDLLVTAKGAASSNVNLFTGDGSGSLSLARGFVFFPADAAAAADFNGDGFLDVVLSQDVAGKVGYGDVICGASVGVGIFFGPSMSTARCIASVPRGIAVQAGDFDGDGRPDIAVVSASGNGLVIYSRLDFVMNTVKTTIVTGGGVLATGMAAPVDLDRDGTLDIVLSHSSGVKTFLGNGDATFRIGGSGGSSTSTRAVAVGDFNEDAIPDIASVESSAGRLLVGAGLGNGTFSTTAIATIGIDLSDVAVADVDHDGHADIVVAHRGGGTIRIFFGGGNGAFVANPALPLSVKPKFLAAHDWDEDGDVDLGILDTGVNGQSARAWMALQDGGGPADVTPPTVTLTSPIAGSIVRDTVAVTASAADNVGVTHVEFYAGARLIARSAGPNYIASWNTGSWPSGPVLLRTSAFDAALNESIWATVQVTVREGSGIPQPHLSLSPSILTFSKRQVGTTSAAQTVHLQNTGSVPVTFFSFNGVAPGLPISAGPDFPIQTTCSNTLASGTGCDFTVTFAPTFGGPAYGAFVISSDAAESPQQFKLAGEGYVLDAFAVMQTIAAGGNRLDDLQRTDGGWEWRVGAGVCGGSCSNTIGVTGLGLIATYYRTSDESALNAAMLAGTLLVTQYHEAMLQNPPGLPKLQDIEFLRAVADFSYASDPALANTFMNTAFDWFDVLVAQYPTGLSRVQALIATATSSHRVSTAGWYAASLIRAAKALGYPAYANEVAVAMLRTHAADWAFTDPTGPATPDNVYTFGDTLLSVGSLMWAAHDLPGFEVELDEGRDFLIAQQDLAGSWGGGDPQISAYATLGLGSIGGTVATVPLRAAATFIIESQQPDGGWRYASGSEYAEVDAELTRAMMTLFNTGTGTNVIAVPSQIVDVTFSNVVTAGTTTVVAIDPAGPNGPFRGFEIMAGLTYDIRTTATYSGNIFTCFNLYWLEPAAFNEAIITHLEGGTVVDATIAGSSYGSRFAPVYPRKCAVTTSLSPFGIVKRDKVKPSMSVELTPSVLWPANEKLVTITASITATDDVDPAPTVTLQSITSSEPARRGRHKDDGDIGSAAFGTDDRMFRLRAERAGDKNDRVYTVGYRVTDRSGNWRDVAAQVVVPRKKPR